MTEVVAYRLGQRAARAANKGDEDGARALVRDVVRVATDLSRRGQRDRGQALAAAFERGYGSHDEPRPSEQLGAAKLTRGYDGGEG
jgi:hypothetical protein